MNNCISVIIPIYNVEKYLAKCIESVLGQTYKNLEIILIDDGSPDNCGKICDKYAYSDRRIRVIHKQNGGVSSARNAGLDIATGEWIYFLDPDDWIEIDTMEKVLKKATETKADMCFFDYENAFEDNSVFVSTLHSDKTLFTNMKDYGALCTYSQAASVWSYIVKAPLILDNIRFDENLYRGEDVVFNFQLYGHIKSFSYLKTVLYHRRIRTESAMAIIRDDYPKTVYDRYNLMVNTVKKGVYPNKVQTVINSMLISELKNIVKLAFHNGTSLRCDYEIIRDYIHTYEYKQALQDYDVNLIGGRANRLCAKLKGDNKLFYTAIYYLSTIRWFRYKRQS